MDPIPAFWKSTLNDIDETVATIKKGKVQVGCITPGGRKVYLIQYGTPNHFKRLANYNSAVGARDLNSYADKTRPEVKPCVLLIAGCHGGEFEGTVALLNLIQLFETGRDFRGQENPALQDWYQKAHILIIPSLNPDGRSRVPFQSVMGMDYKTFRGYDQGIWKDGSFCDWPQVKRVHPIKDAVQYLGGYFNDDGVNIMHDNYFLSMAEETKLLTRTASEYAPDFSVDFHGVCGNDPFFIPASVTPPAMLEEIGGFACKVRDACEKEKIPFSYKEGDFTPSTGLHSIGVSGAIHLCCGAYAMTHESQQGIINNPPEKNSHEWKVTHEAIYREHMIVMEQIRQFTEELNQRRKQNSVYTFQKEGRASMWGFLAYLRRMRYIYRWQLMKNIRQENLSEHSMDTAAIVHLLGMIHNQRFPRQEPLDLYRLVTLAIYHDCSEIFTGDMPTPVKYANARLRDAYKALERDAAGRLLDTLPPDFREAYAACFEPATQEERRFLKAADRLSALLKCEEESQQGNEDFRSAQQKIRQSLEKMEMEEIKIFLQEFYPACQMNPDELSRLSGETMIGN